MTKKVNNIKISTDKKRGNKKKRPYTPVGFYYSFLTIVLLLCLVQITCGAVLNISKLISYQSKIAQLQKTKDKAELRNKQLKEDIADFSAASSLEAIARNNLKMAGDDEVLVIINTKPKEEEEIQQNKGFVTNLLSGLKKND